MIGYDIDGVITKGIVPVKGSVVISGRTFGEYDISVKYLAQHHPVYIRGKGRKGDNVDTGKFKAMMINYLGITEFYEDNNVQIMIIKGLCPDCIIRKI